MMNGRKTRPALLGLATALALAGCAATPEPLEVVDDASVVPLDEFATRPTDDLWSAERILGLPVRGSDGQELGEVENLVVGPDDRLRAMIVEAGGFLDIGDTHLRVPWNEISVDPTEELEYVDVPFSRGDDFERYASDGRGASGDGPREWRADELIGDYVSLDDSAVEGDYGTVRDLMFTSDGQLESVVVNASYRYGGGYYNYPYRGYGYGFSPGLSTYGLGYGTGAIGGYGPFSTYGTFGGPI